MWCSTIGRMGREPRSTRRSFGRLRQFRSGRWKASYTGPDLRLYEAPATFSAKEDAEAWLTDRRREIDRELWSPPATEEQAKTAKRQQAAGEKFAEYAERWVRTRMVKGRPLAPRTREHYGQLLAQHINPTFGKKPLRDINMAMVDNWYAKTLTDKATARAHSYSLLKSILETARERDRLIQANPCVIRGAGTTKRKMKPKSASAKQLGIIIRAMPPQLQAMTILASWNALRFGETVELRRGDVVLSESTETDQEGNEIIVPHGVLQVRRGAARAFGQWEVDSLKTDSSSRDVTIPPHMLPPIMAHLAEYVGPEQDALLFPPLTGETMKDGKPRRLQPSTVYRHFYKARNAAGRPDLKWHQLRGTGATMALISGSTLAEVQKFLGHSTVGAALMYQYEMEGRDALRAKRMSALALEAENQQAATTSSHP